MIRIGILGSDSSHALAFAKLVNHLNAKTGRPNYPGVKITGIFGEEAEQTEKVASEGSIEFIAETPEILLDNADAVMTVFRHGDKHARYSLPFIERGLPVWIDKPFESSVQAAKQMIDASKKSGSPITGGTSVKYCNDVLTLCYAVKNDPGFNKILGGYMNFPGDLASEYNGIFFYSPHMVETVLSIFGLDVRSVKAEVYNGELTVFARYDSFQVVMNFLRGVSTYAAAVYGEEKTIVREIDITTSYRSAFDKFYNMLHTGHMPETYEALLRPVEVMEAIDLSVKTGKETVV